MKLILKKKWKIQLKIVLKSVKFGKKALDFGFLHEGETRNARLHKKSFLFLDEKDTK